MTNGLGTPALKPRDFARICELAHQRCGLNLKEGKERLVSARLSKLIRGGGFRSFEAYYEHVVGDRSGDALIAMIDSLTTNHTSFLREPEHFRYLSEHVLPEFAGRSTVRVWSAACSTGEEPYSILFTALSRPPASAPVGVDVRATDISTRVLGIARAGNYPRERLDSLPPDWLTRFFDRQAGAARTYTVKTEYRRNVRFERLNLMEPFPRTEPHAVIFCRNVMIYFDRETRSNLVQKLAASLEPGGYLFVGHAESLIGIDHPLTYIRPAVYRRPVGGRGRAK